MPPGFPRRQIAGILQQHLSWITRQLAQIHPAEDSLPQQLSLPCLQRSWVVEVARSDSGQSRLEECDGILKLNLLQAADYKPLLQHWLRVQAQQFLPQRLQQLAAEHGFHYARCQIRSQKTRWGSCSNRGTISLNDRLLLASGDTVDYVLLHELAHTEHPNHSPAFWRRVAHTGVDAKRHRQLLHQLSRQMPSWAVVR